jgi:hypothetical protein
MTLGGSLRAGAVHRAWIPELIAAAGSEVTETYIDFFTSTIRNRKLGLLTRGLAGSFLTGVRLRV